jgi:hypothetical protein
MRLEDIGKDKMKMKRPYVDLGLAPALSKTLPRV